MDQGQNPKKTGKMAPQAVHTRFPIKSPNTMKIIRAFLVVSSGSALKYLKARSGIEASQKACKLHKMLIIKSSTPTMSIPKKKPKYAERHPAIPNHKAKGIMKI
jgi:hypothetical protein